MTRSWLRTLLVLGTVTMSVFLIAVLQSLLTTLDDMSRNPNSTNRLVVRHKSGLTQMLPRSHEAFLRQQPEVETVCGVQWFGGYYQDPNQFFANFASDEATLYQVFREEFGYAQTTEAELKAYIRDGTGCIVGETLAKKHGWKVGDVVPLTGTIFPVNPRLTIRQIFKSKKLSDENVLHFHTKVLEEGVPAVKGLVGTYFLRVKRADDIPALASRIDRHFANSAYETLSETENAFNLSFVKMLGNITGVIQGISLAVLLAVLVVTAGTMAMVIRERGTEVAVFRAMGFRSGQVLALQLAEGTFLTLLGGGVGLVLSVFVADGVRTVLGSATPFLADFAVAPRTMVLVMAQALGLGFFATFIPSWQASRRPIIEGLRSL